MSEQDQAGLPAEELADVMAGIGKAAPFLRAISDKGKGSASPSHRQALLHALRPYLSPARRDAADYLLRLWQMGELLKNFTKGE